MVIVISLHSVPHHLAHQAIVMGSRPACGRVRNGGQYAVIVILVSSSISGGVILPIVFLRYPAHLVIGIWYIITVAVHKNGRLPSFPFIYRFSCATAILLA